MTEYELKEMLHSYRNLKKELMEIKEALKEIEASMLSPQKSNSNIPINGSRTGDPTMGVVSRHINLEKLYQDKLEEISKTQIGIEALIEKLNPLERRIMRSRYYNGLTWEKIAIEFGYSLRQMHRKHKNILQKILENKNHL